MIIRSSRKMQGFVIATLVQLQLVLLGALSSAWPIVVVAWSDRSRTIIGTTIRPTTTTTTKRYSAVSHINNDGNTPSTNDYEGPEEEEEAPDDMTLIRRSFSVYDLGSNKNPPVGSLYGVGESAASNWVVPTPVSEINGVRPPRPPLPPPQSDPQQQEQQQQRPQEQTPNFVHSAPAPTDPRRVVVQPTTVRRMVPRDQHASTLRAALWDEQHFHNDGKDPHVRSMDQAAWHPHNDEDDSYGWVKVPGVVYPNIDMSIPNTVYNEGDNGEQAVDLVWDNLRWEAYQEAQREPLLVSFLYSTILNHKSLESSLAFLLANRLQSSAMMISTQLQSIIKDTLEMDPEARRALRCDMMAVRDRDPACNALTDVFLYFKGFHALQSYRVAHNLWKRGKRVLSSYLQSQVSQVFQIDIHPNATMKSGIMLDHGTGIVIGSTAQVGYNCSILHHVTLGGSGKKGLRRHPWVGDGVLLGAGATVLGPVNLGDGSQVGAGTLVISDLPAHCVAVGVPARIIGSFIDVTMQPSVGMDQMIEGNSHLTKFKSEGI